jgi:glycosyltransferase involved in cell wall biosynthesis
MTSVKKVLHVIPSVSPFRGGPTGMVRALAARLVLNGVETHVATTNDNGAEKLDVICGVPHLQEDGVTYWYFPRQTRLYTVSWPLCTWLKNRVADYDVVHIHALFSFASAPTAYWAHRRGVPYIVRPLGTLSLWGMRNRRRWLKKLSYRVIESRILRHASLVHYTSEQEQREAESLGITTSAQVIPNAVAGVLRRGTFGAFRDRYPQLRGREIILFLSRLDAKKGLDILLDAFAIVCRERPEAFLVIAGDGESAFVQRLKADATALGLENAVMWPGFLSGVDKEAAFAESAMFVLPSYSENFGIAVGEAMAAGLPVVVSDQVGIHVDIARAAAGVVVRCDVTELAHAMLRLLGDAHLRASLSRNGMQLVSSRYSQDAVTANVVDLYNRIAG